MSNWIKQSTSVVISFGPFLDKTDGVTLETGLVSALDHGTTGIKLSKNGGALTIRHASVTASTYDAFGMYRVTLDATDTNTLGTIRVAFEEAATCLPVWQDLMILPANVYDSLVGGTDILDVSMTQILGTAVATPATAGVLDVNTKNAGNVAWASGAIVAGAIASGAITNAKFAAGAIDANALSADAKTDIAYTTWEENVVVHTMASAGQKLYSAEYQASLMVDGGDYTGLVDRIWNEDATTHTSPGTTGKYLDEANTAKLIVDATNSTVTSIYSLIGTPPSTLANDLADIKAKTDNLPAAPAAVGDIPTAAANADAVWDEARSGHVAAGSFGENVVADVTKVGGNAASISPTAGVLNTRLVDISVGGLTVLGGASIGNVVNPVAVNSLANNVVTSAALDASASNEIADALLDRANAIDAGLTPRHALELAAASVLQKLTGAGTGTERVRNFSDTADLATVTVDGNGNKSAIIYDFSI